MYVKCSFDSHNSSYSFRAFMLIDEASFGITLYLVLILCTIFYIIFYVLFCTEIHHAQMPTFFSSVGDHLDR